MPLITPLTLFCCFRWAVSNREMLIAQNSSLEFKLHRLYFISLLMGGTTNQREALQYAKNFQPFALNHQKGESGVRPVFLCTLGREPARGRESTRNWDSLSVVQAGLTLILLCQPPECWEYRGAPPAWLKSEIFNVWKEPVAISCVCHTHLLTNKIVGIAVMQTLHTDTRAAVQHWSQRHCRVGIP